MNKKLLLFLFSVFIFLGSNSVFASHIVGGDITVAYTGTPNTFNVTVKLYRDCSSSTQFENTIYVGVFDKSTNVSQQTLTISNPAVTTLSLGTACYTPGICISRAVYTLNSVSIPDNVNGYYLSYLRCCRNAVIANISNPSNEGFVAYCEIPNPALHDN